MKHLAIHPDYANRVLQGNIMDHLAILPLCYKSIAYALGLKTRYFHPH